MDVAPFRTWGRRVALERFEGQCELTAGQIDRYRPMKRASVRSAVTAPILGGAIE